MLKIVVPNHMFYNDYTNRFVEMPNKAIRLEHSLLSLSFWESKWHKSFLESQKTRKETEDYIRCMCLDDDVDPLYFTVLSSENIKQIGEYIDDRGCASCISEIRGMNSGCGKRDTFTAELIYFYMFTFGIDKSCEEWHLNRLLTLLKIFCMKNADPKKPAQKDLISRNRMINKANRQKYNTRG